MPEIAPSAPSTNVAMSESVNDESIATGRPVARSARRFCSNATMSFDQSFTAATCGISASRASVSGAYPMPEAGGYSKTTIGRPALSAISPTWRRTMSGFSRAPHMKSVGGKTRTPVAPAARASRASSTASAVPSA